ncbi:ABC transporter ATP-binding protein [Sporomusa sp.]|uniref:ABC transporter ATP-binding protein n=1 Tax=Sporomusa sp. TaxID=2078658 RepID=UPI002C8EB24F|nr:ABC transporter ATP-binding protein [Sporomusa sp.]HWR05584.1 ABC transporter ATP-binding protein [Sporomusa sp.]
MTIALVDVRKTYNISGSEVFALDGVNLTIPTGEFTAIMGPAGSGKSTLMKILGCLDRPTVGSYTLDGQEVTHLTDAALAATRKKKIGFVDQNFSLLPRMSALQNTTIPLIYAGIGKEERYERAEQALLTVGLDKCLRQRPNEMSDCQRQRVAIAQALVNNPDIILADEPTGNLDTKAGDEIMDVFSSLSQQGHTVVIVTHAPDIARRMCRVVHVRNGRIVRDDKI